MCIRDSVQFFDNDWNKTYAAFRLESERFPGLTAKDGVAII